MLPTREACEPLTSLLTTHITQVHHFLAMLEPRPGSGPRVYELPVPYACYKLKGRCCIFLTRAGFSIRRRGLDPGNNLKLMCGGITAPA